VLHLSPELESSDPGRETADLAILTQRSGWRAVVASSGGRLINEVERAAVRHVRMPLNKTGPFSNWRVRILIETVLQTERPALLHVHGVETLPFALAVSRARGLPLVADITQPVAKNVRTIKLLEQIKTVRALIRVPSEFMANHLRDDFGILPDQLCLIPPGVDLQWYSVGFISPERLQKISHLWRLPEQASIVLAPMPLEPQMGHAVLLSALRSMKDDPVYTVMVGTDRYNTGMRADVEAQISAYGLNGKVITPDDCPDLPAACWLSSVVVAPNIAPRGQTQELIAAQAIGRPVIVSDVGANREMVLDGETAWVLPPGDVDSLVKAIREAIQLNTDQRLDVANRTHNFAANTFPQAEWFNGMMQMYESLLYPSRQATATRANVA
jgi:glycosyltransferase involved in cell wall biosynthesis